MMYENPALAGFFYFYGVNVFFAGMPFYIIIIIASFLASVWGLICMEERRPVLMLFSFFLLLSAAVETYGWRLSIQYRNTVLLYNLFSVVEFLFYLFFFRQVFTQRKIKNIILWIMGGYLLLSVLNIFLIQKGTFHSYTYVLGCMLVVFFSVVYFYLLFRFPETGSLARNPFFWIGTGLLFYYTCTFSIYGLQNLITHSLAYYNRVLTYIEDLLNIVLYSLFSIGFLCKINIRRLSGSL